MPNQGGSYVLRDGKRVPGSRSRPMKDPLPAVGTDATDLTDRGKVTPVKVASSPADKTHKVKEPSNG